MYIQECNLHCKPFQKNRHIGYPHEILHYVIICLLSDSDYIYTYILDAVTNPDYQCHSI